MITTQLPTMNSTPNQIRERIEQKITKTKYKQFRREIRIWICIQIDQKLTPTVTIGALQDWVSSATQSAGSCGTHQISWPESWLQSAAARWPLSGTFWDTAATKFRWGSSSNWGCPGRGLGRRTISSWGRRWTAGRSGRKSGPERSRCRWPPRFWGWQLHIRWGRGRICSSSSSPCKTLLWGGTGGLGCRRLDSPTAGLELALSGRGGLRRRMPESGGGMETGRQEIRLRNPSGDWFQGRIRPWRGWSPRKCWHCRGLWLSFCTNGELILKPLGPDSNKKHKWEYE